MTAPFSFQQRKDWLSFLKKERPQWDVCVVGGGITGTSVAREAAKRGLRVLLLEKGDLASGTSSASSKLIHGGLRYLQSLEFSLVFEALSERTHLLQEKSHLVHPLSFVIPVWKKRTPPSWLLRLGLWLYDGLSLFRTPAFHRFLSRKTLFQKIPFLNKDISSAFLYADASMWDDVLTVERAQEAARFGAWILPYVKVVKPLWRKKSVWGVFAQEEGEKKAFPVPAVYTVFCLGPWSDLFGKQLSSAWQKSLRPSQGIHLVLDWKDLPLSEAVVMHHPRDGRIAFAIPRKDWGKGAVIVGTTDAPLCGDVDHLHPSSQEVQYLLALLRDYFPSLALSAKHIRSIYAGARPLVYEEKKELSQISREHRIWEPVRGAVFVTGGKYTTHRVMAQQAVDFVLRRWGERFRERELFSYPVLTEKKESPVKRSFSWIRKRWKQKVTPFLERYGDQAFLVEALQKKYAFLGRVPEGFPYLWGECAYAIQKEMVLYIEDFCLRRVPLFWLSPEETLSLLPIFAEIFSREMGLSSEQKQSLLQRAEKILSEKKSWIDHAKGE